MIQKQPSSGCGKQTVLYMKMRSSVLDTFPIACCLMSLVLNGAGSLLILQRPERVINNTVARIRYTCISEDDRTALVWNRDLKYYDRKQHTPKESQSIQGRNIIRCALTGPENCTAYWRESAGWEIVDSRDHPMGPVFDSRWEDFAEIDFQRTDYPNGKYHHIMKMRKTGYVAFSVRGTQSINIRICGKSEIVNGSCLTITLGSNSDMTKKHRNYCMFTDTKHTDLRHEIPCTETAQAAQFKGILFSGKLWRTFSLKWNMKNIRICSEFQCLFEIPLKQDSTLTVKDLAINMADKGLIRFHFYDYLLSTTASETLDSNRFYNNKQNLCYEFITSLCDECYLEIYVVNVKGVSEWLAHIHRNRSVAFGGMLTWQHVKLTKTLKDNYMGQLSFKFITRYDPNNSQPSSQPRWAIDTLRKCKSPDARRKLPFKRILSKIPNTVPPQNYCQKMSNDTRESLAVNSYFTSASDNILIGTQEYLRQASWIQVPCLSNWWERISICDQSGCVCIEKSSNSVGTDEKLEVNQTRTFLELKLPSIVNEKRNSVVTIVVKGSPMCMDQKLPKELRNYINMTGFEEGWVVETFSADQLRPGEIVTIKKRPEANDTSRHCPLHPGGIYIILVVVVAKADNTSAFRTSLPIHITVDETTSEHYLVPLLCLVILLLVICFFSICLWRLKVSSAVKRICRQDSTADSKTLVNSLETTALISEQSASPVETMIDHQTFMVDDIYEEIISKRASLSRSVQNFENYVKQAIAKGLLQSQFKMFQKGLVRPCEYGLLPENTPKNRYPYIIPYDDTRVILRKISGDPYSNYINANYVQGYLKKNAYIATQNPTYRTVQDFWRMIWEKNASIICMLADVVDDKKVKCMQYWPQLGASEQYGNIVVTTERRHVFADYILRTFQLSCGQTMRNIDHLYYSGWPVHSIPSYNHSVVTCLKKLLAMPIGKGPIVVHSNAGTGRTGVFILCDMCLRRAAITREIDVLAELRKLRDCRPNMVENELQYIFAHIVLAECLVSVPTNLPWNSDLHWQINLLKKQIPKHIQRLCDTEWQNQALRFDAITRKPPNSKHNKMNRAFREAPINTSFGYPQRYRMRNNDSGFINPVVVDGLRVKKQYLACQLSQISTEFDFWRLVEEQGVQLVIVLQQTDPNDFAYRESVADKDSSNPVPYVNVEIRTSINSGNCFVTDELFITEMLEGVAERSRSIRMLTCTKWGMGKNGTPPPPKDLVNFWITSQNIRRKEGPTLVLCHDGVTGCGLYLALSFMLERMAVEQECDIILAVRAVRRSRSDFVQSQEQFEYLYDAAAEYIESFKTYTNFT